MATNPILGFCVNNSDIKYIGEGLSRPESVIVDCVGRVITSCLNENGCTIIDSKTHKQSNFSILETDLNSLPNGLTISNNGMITIANYGLQEIFMKTNSSLQKFLPEKYSKQLRSS